MYFKKWADFKKLNEAGETTTTAPAVPAAPVTNTTQTQPAAPASAPTTGATPSPAAPVAPATPNASTAGAVAPVKLTDEQLQGYLMQWNEANSHYFKFINDMPKTVQKESTLNDLLSNILPDENGIKYREMVSKAIANLTSAPNAFFKDKRIVDAFNGKEILVVGYTSTTASSSYNQELSARRARIVANAIRDGLRVNKITINAVLKEVGKGEDPNSLIVINDQDLNDVKFGKMAPDSIKNDQKMLDKLKNSKEERQKLNRRVKITLPQFIAKEPSVPKILVVAPAVASKQALKESKKPEIPDPNSITFNWDSYILSKKGQDVLATFCEEIKKWNTDTKEDDKKIKALYISAHTSRGKEKDNSDKTRDEKRRDRKLAILSANRARRIEMFISGKLGEEIKRGIVFHTYPVAFYMNKAGEDNRKIYLDFMDSNHMKTAKQQFEKLAGNYDIPVGQNGLNLTTYMENKTLKEDIRYNIKNIAEARKRDHDRYIPLELYYDELDNYDGLNETKEERDAFKKDTEKLIQRMNRKYDGEYTMEEFVHTPE